MGQVILNIASYGGDVNKDIDEDYDVELMQEIDR
jgi:hypothetical protein